MYVYFPDGTTASVSPQDTVMVGGFGTKAYPPAIANGGLMGAVTSGSMNPFRTQTYGTLLVINQNGTTTAWVQMDSQAAANTAYENIGIALEADAQSIVIAADGSYSVAS